MKICSSILFTALPRVSFTSFPSATPKAIRKAALLLSSVALLLGSTAAVRGQSALDGFDPNADGTIHVVVVQPDGKILIGGEFTTLSPNGGAAVTRNHIARLNPDGTLDTAFDPNANDVVYSIAVQADGKILAGGSFTSIGGQTRNFIARLDATTGLADSFDPNADYIVGSIAVQADGKILAGGYFSSIGGQTRNYIARLDATTGAADSFDPNANGYVFSIAVQADGKILVGGNFFIIDGQTRQYIARLDATTGLADSFDPNANSNVRSIAVQVDGKILAGGDFNGANSIGGQTRNYIARLDPTTGAADSFDPNANSDVLSIAVQADGKILTGGLFTSIGGQARSNIARLDPTTGLADSFNVAFECGCFVEVFSIAVQADGKILAGGSFTSIGGVTRNHIARLEADGRLDQTLDLSTVGSYVTATAVQPDGKILIGGLFSSVLGVTRNNIARLNTDGTLDTAFDPNANNAVYSIAVQADGKILAGGFFTSIGGQTRNYIARLDATTGLADSFDPNANNGVFSIAVQADGNILAGGAFTSIGGQTRIHIARLDATTGAADSFDPNANNVVRSIAVQADGKILAGGDFSSIGGATRNGIARLDATTGAADSFDPNANNAVYSIVVQADGNILAGGPFTSIGGQTRNRIARLDPTTGLADSFDPNANNPVLSIAVQADGKILASGVFTNIGGQTRNYIARLDPTTGLADSFDPNANSYVFSIAVQADGKILVGGQFTSIGGQTRNFFARLSNDTAALQNLAVTHTTVTWTLGGSSSQFTRVTFEYSTDNINYTLLGAGTVTAGGKWTLTGQSFPIAQNFYIRSRGYYRSGYQNGSESMRESVRNAFPTVLVTVQTSPGGLAYSVDGTNYSAYPPQTFSWAAGSPHTIATTTPQSGGPNIRYYFSSWSDGGAISHTVTPTNKTTYTAKFGTQYYLTMVAGAGGKSVTPTSSWRTSGSVVSISATALPGYSFTNWTGSGSGSYSGTDNPRSITMNGPITETAAFAPPPTVQVTVQTTPVGRAFSVDGTNYSATQVFTWATGSPHTIAITTTPQAGAPGVRYYFSSWSDGGAISHSVAPTKTTTYTAKFGTQYFLTMNAGTGGHVSPASNWKTSGSSVSISATPSTGYSFSNWTGSGAGSYSGTDNPRSITMLGPITETAAFTHN